MHWQPGNAYGLWQSVMICSNDLHCGSGRGFVPHFGEQKCCGFCLKNVSRRLIYRRRMTRMSLSFWRQFVTMRFPSARLMYAFAIALSAFSADVSLASLQIGLAPEKGLAFHSTDVAWSSSAAPHERPTVLQANPADTNSMAGLLSASMPTVGSSACLANKFTWSPVCNFEYLLVDHFQFRPPSPIDELIKIPKIAVA